MFQTGDPRLNESLHLKLISPGERYVNGCKKWAFFAGRFPGENRIDDTKVPHKSPAAQVI
jgi:hypothetical protein